MRIAIVGNSAQSLLTFRASMIKRLVKRGVVVLAYAPDYTPESAAAVAKFGATPVDYDLQRSGTNPLSDARAVLSIYRSLRRERPQAILCYFIKPAIYGTIAALLAGIPRRIVLLEGLGYGFASLEKSSFKRRAVAFILQLMLRLSFRFAHQVIVLNDDDLDVVTRQLGVPRARAANMGGIGVELDDYAIAPVRAAATSFGLAARLIQEKGVLDFVAAAQKVKSVYPGTSFYLLGDVDDNPGSLARSLVSSWVDEQIVIWPGRVADVQYWLRKCDVFVLPSYYREGVPRSIQEAMALGRAIITTDHVGCRDTVVPGTNGYLVTPRNVDEIAAAMIKFVENPGLAQVMGAESRKLAERRFDARRADEILIGYLEPQYPSARGMSG